MDSLLATQSQMYDLVNNLDINAINNLTSQQTNDLAHQYVTRKDEIRTASTSSVTSIVQHQLALYLGMHQVLPLCHTHFATFSRESIVYNHML